MGLASATAQRRETLFNEVREQLLAEITEGRLSVGARLPSEPSLALELQISRPTLREVLRSLEADGVIRRVRGIGTFVSRTQPLVRTSLDLDVGVTEAVTAARAVLGIEVLGITMGLAPAWAAMALQLPADGRMLSVERVIRVEGIPAVHGLDVIPTSVTDRSAAAYDGGSIYRYLEQDCHVELAGGVAEVTAVAATPGLATALRIHRGTPLLRLDQVERSSVGRPVLCSREHYAPGVFSLMVRRPRQQRADLSAVGVDAARSRTDGPQRTWEDR
jgi:GntR family transcriptional regulator